MYVREVKIYCEGYPFGYKERDIVDGIIRTQQRFDEFKSDLGKAGVDQQYTERVIARYGKALDYTRVHRPAEIIKTLQGLHSQIAQLEGEGKNRLDIAREIETENSGLIVILRDITQGLGRAIISKRCCSFI